MQETSSKGVQNYVWLGRKSVPLGIMQEIKIWPYFQRVYAQTKIHPR